MKTKFNLSDKIEEWIEQLEAPESNSYSKDGKLQLQGLTIGKEDFDLLENIHKEFIRLLKEEINQMTQGTRGWVKLKENVDEIAGEKLI